MLEIKLKRDWDSFPSYYEKKGHFVGRHVEKNKLVNDFLRKSNGSILVSGARGIGKTALVYQALQEAVTANNVRTIELVPIILNGSQLDMDESKLKKEILNGLIRRVYTNLIFKRDLDGKRKSELSKLYKKAMSAEVKIRDISTTSQSTTESMSSKKENNFEINIRFKIILFVAFLYILFLKPPPEQVNTVVAFLLVVLTTSVASSVYNYISTKITNKDKLNTNLAEETYITDSSPDNLEYDLYEFLKSIKGKYKIIFVFDELDKLGDQKVISIVRIYKNLFNISSALSVFVTDHITYDHISETKDADDKRYRNIEHTLFPDKLFLTRPDFKDLNGFLKDIVESPKIKRLEKDTLWNDFKMYLCFRCKMDFFELNHIIRDYITDYDADSGPIIRLKNLDSEQLFESRMQKIICQIFDSYKISERTQGTYNEDLLASLYSFISEGLKNDENKFYIGMNGDHHFIKAKKSLCNYMARLEVIKLTGEETTKKDNKRYKKYILATRKGFSVPDSININLEYETTYLHTYDELIGTLRCIMSIYDTLNPNTKTTETEKENFTDEGIKKIKEITGLDFSKQVEYDKTEKDLKKKHPVHIPKEELEKIERFMDTELKKTLNLPNIIFRNLLYIDADVKLEFISREDIIDKWDNAKSRGYRDL